MRFRKAPYQAGGLVTDPRLLELRRLEIDAALDIVAPSTGTGHAILVGERRSGRTSTLAEIARRAAHERNRLVVQLRPLTSQITDHAALVRHLLIAAVEAVSDAGKEPSAWYEAWRNRVYLRDRSPGTPDDVLISALLLAEDPSAVVHPLLLVKDLRTLQQLASAAGFDGILVALDDASDLTADINLTEHVVTNIDDAGGCSLLLATLPATQQHFQEAMSPCLRRFRPVYLQEFWRHEIMACLSAPLDPADRERLVPKQQPALAADLDRLTGGNPFEVMLVANRMWEECEVGESERLTLTPRVLDRVVRDLAALTGGRDLLNGAMAIRRLDRDKIQTALELVAFSRLTAREIAIARCLGVTSRETSAVRREVHGADIEQELEKVIEELVALEEAGVITLSADGESLTVRGGRPAFVLLKYEARAVQGPKASDRPFGLDFLYTVGRALLRDVFSAAARSIDGTQPLASYGIELMAGELGRRSPRSAAGVLSREQSAAPIMAGDLSLSIGTPSNLERVAELLQADDDISLALVSAGTSNGSNQLEYVELWLVPNGTKQELLTQRLADAVDDVIQMFELAELRWRGTEGTILHAQLARDALIALAPFAALKSVGDIFGAYRADQQQDKLAAATDLAFSSVRILRMSHVRSWQQAVFLSPMLSHLGFLLAFDDGRLEEAQEALSESLEVGEGDDWVTHWNLANVAARRGAISEALGHLDVVSEKLSSFSSSALVVLFVPEISPTEAIISVSAAGSGPILALQRAILHHLAEPSQTAQLGDAIAACQEIEDEGAERAGQLASNMLPSIGTAGASSG